MTMYFEVVEPVLYIYSISPRKVRYSRGLVVSRFSTGNKTQSVGQQF